MRSPPMVEATGAKTETDQELQRSAADLRRLTTELDRERSDRAEQHGQLEGRLGAQELSQY